MTTSGGDVVVGTLNPGQPRPLAFVHGGLLALMISRAVKCLGLKFVDLATAQGLVEVNGKKIRAYHFTFSVVDQAD